ncbi:MAG: class A beta-lactamase-related serine hydrolase [Candidatus Omnitrophica bacterium]|nr:class A beta-lactamase-related serine hydrolase [Candidatus Omnitrophota bacterium]
MNEKLLEIMKKKKIVLIILFIIIGLSSSFLYKNYKNRGRTIKNEQVLLETKRRAWLKLKDILENKIRHFKGTVSLVVKNLDSNWEITFNKGTLIPSASLVKIPIMLSCFYAAQDGKISLKDTIALKSSDKVSGSKVLGKDPAGSVFTVEELFNPMITQSDNVAANILIDFLGFDTLNSYFKKMGLKNTNIARKMMDFKERKGGVENYTTAQDMAYLLEELYYQKFLNKDVSERCLELLGQQRINDRIPRKLPKNGTFIAHKTGLERHICHDVGIVFTNKGNFLICVLVKHENKFAKPAKKLISDMALLVYNYYQNL